MPSAIGTPVVVGWTRSMDFAGRCVISGAMGLVTLASLSPMMSEFERLEVAGRVGLVALLVVQVAVCVLTLTARNTLIVDVVVVLVTAGGLGLVLAGQPLGPWQASWWPTSAVHSVQLYVLAFGRRHQWVLGGFAVALFASLRLIATVRTGDPLVLGLVEVIVGVQLSLTVVLAAWAGRRIAAQYDRVEAERTGVLAAQYAREDEERRSYEVNRFLHDEVISSLCAIAQPRERVPAQQIRNAAARTAARLRPGQRRGCPAASAGEVGVGLQQVAAELGLRASVDGRLTGVPDEVAQALEQAGAEALRNIARHAGTDQVGIRLTGRRGRVEVLISDNGRGFDTSDLDTSHLGSGLRDSVLRRMADIGGVATIDSGQGGTTVELSWAPESAQERVDQAWSDLTQALTPMVWPGIGGLLLTGVLMLPQIANPPLMLIGLLVVTGVAVLVVRWPSRNLPPFALPLLLGAAVVGVLANYLAVEPDLRNGYHLLMAGGVSYLLILVVIHYSTRWAILAALVIWGSVLGLGLWRFGPAAMVGPLVGASTGPVLGLALVPLKSVLRRVVGRTLLAGDAIIRSRNTILDSAQRSADDDERIGRTRERVLPFLEAVAEGRLELPDPSTTSRALALEAAVREELRWGHAPRAVLRAGIRTRGLGWQLQLRLTEEQVVRDADAVVHLLDALGPPAGSGPVVLSAFDGLAVVVQEPSAEAVQRWRDRDDLSVREAEEWCRLRVRGAPKAAEVPERRDSPDRNGDRTLPV